jgi:6-pyruvoyltetrahydropterin/6-carboxytetrahydropterin synthase
VVDLTRTVRFCLSEAAALGTAVRNSYSAWPAMRGLGRYYELRVRCRGEADAGTGYFINIKHIDAAVRSQVLPYLQSVLDEGAGAATPLGRVMKAIFDRLHTALAGRVVEARLQLTPYHALSLEAHAMDSVIVRQQFEFSAAHRLHAPHLSDKENRDIFGKCNNPSGHGHNYRLEVAVRCPIDIRGHVRPAEELDALVDDVVIQKLDHKHLNIDVPQFAQLNPSVENIAHVIYHLLHEAVRRIGVSLVEVTVWETGKTMCTYAGPAPMESQPQAGPLQAGRLPSSRTAH